jgi:methenyltetrahydrofolate cyclohydrolase
VRGETVEQLLESLASPGDGAGGLRSGALHAAVGASFVARAGGGGAVDLREAALRLAGAAPVEPGEAVEAARTAVRVIEVAERALGLAETLRPGDRRLVSDVAAAAEALRAAVGTARVEVEVHLAGITDPVVREELLLAIDPVDDVVLRAAKVTAVVREQLLR